MSVRIRIDMSDFSRVAQLLESFPEALDTNIANSMLTEGLQIEQDAQRYAPKKTGYMASQIRFEMLPYSKWAFHLVGRAPYTFYQEFGTSRIQPHLFMTLSLAMHQASMLNAVSLGIQAAREEVFGY